MTGIQRVLAVPFAVAAMVALAQPAAAARLDVTVEVTNKGSYTASLCGFDWLGGRCNSGLRAGETTKIKVHPRSREDLVWARVVPNRGGFDEKAAIAAEDRVCFEATGSKKEPSVDPVDCA